MHVWNVLYASCWRSLLKIHYAKNRHLRTIPQLCWALSLQLRHASTTGKKLVKQQCLLHTFPQYGELRLTNGCDQLVTLGHSGKRVLLRHCTYVSQWRPTKLCTMFGCLLGWYTMYTFLGALAPLQNFARCKIHFSSKSCVLLYCQRYCTALDQWVSAKLCSMVQRMELWNFRRGRHIYSAGRPSRWALAHILVC